MENECAAGAGLLAWPYGVAANLSQQNRCHQLEDIITIIAGNMRLSGFDVEGVSGLCVECSFAIDFEAQFPGHNIAEDITPVSFTLGGFSVRLVFLVC